MARGPFVLWGDPRENLIRGDFYGPDGKPVVSVRGDSTGLLVYLPQEEQASFTPSGLRAGNGTIPTRDMLFLIRTGFPLVMQQWQIIDLADTDDGTILWEFTAGDDHVMVLTMDSGSLFPDRCLWDGGEFTITASSPHDEYRAWPWNWGIRIGDDLVTLELTDISNTPVPSEGIWSMVVPVPIDSLEEASFWQPSDTLPQR